jgi:SAM-dependent methyltransferase
MNTPERQTIRKGYANKMTQNTSAQVWERANQAETEYWGLRSTDQIGLIHDLNHAYPLACLIQSEWPNRPFGSVLEVGVGGLGVGLLWMFPHTTRRVGVDPIPLMRYTGACEAMGAFVNESRRDTEYFTSDSNPLPFAGSQFDLVICCNVLDHTDSPARVLKEIHRVLAPGGRLAFGVDTCSERVYVSRKIGRLLDPNAEDYRLHPWDFRYRDVEQLLIDCGFSIQRANRRTRLGNLAGPQKLLGWLCQK